MHLFALMEKLVRDCGLTEEEKKSMPKTEQYADLWKLEFCINKKVESLDTDSLTNIHDDNDKKRAATILVAILSQKFFALYYTQNISMKIIRLTDYPVPGIRKAKAQFGYYLLSYAERINEAHVSAVLIALTSSLGEEVQDTFRAIRDNLKKMDDNIRGGGNLFGLRHYLTTSKGSAHHFSFQTDSTQSLVREFSKLLYKKVAVSSEVELVSTCRDKAFVEILKGLVKMCNKMNKGADSYMVISMFYTFEFEIASQCGFEGISVDWRTTSLIVEKECLNVDGKLSPRIMLKYERVEEQTSNSNSFISHILYKTLRSSNN